MEGKYSTQGEGEGRKKKIYCIKSQKWEKESKIRKWFLAFLFLFECDDNEPVWDEEGWVITEAKVAYRPNSTG